SYQTAPSRDIYIRHNHNGAEDRNRTGTIFLRSQDFKSCASACSATPAIRCPIGALLFCVFMAPRVGFDPTTYRLTAGCSTIELPRNIHLAASYSPRASPPKYHRR